MSKGWFDRLLGFLSGVFTTSLIALIVGVVFLESNDVGIWAVTLAISAMLSILMLRGIPVNRIEIGEKFSIDFEIRDDE